MTADAFERLLYTDREAGTDRGADGRLPGLGPVGLGEDRSWLSGRRRVEGPSGIFAENRTGAVDEWLPDVAQFHLRPVVMTMVMSIPPAASIAYRTCTSRS